jgi:hypothetical protein
VFISEKPMLDTISDWTEDGIALDFCIYLLYI